MRSQLEILAPVGAQEQLLAAVRCGADAVYLGLSAFNARRNAANFDAEALQRAVAYCHAREVRVHVALNTLLLDAELDAFADAVRDVAAAGADAVIVQDIGAAALVRRVCPTLPLHASTQMAVHNAAGVEMLGHLGFSRVVLARELTVEEIAAIASSTPLEIEVFIHGALCMSTSGCCTLSCMLGGRSGNRGLCAQPCRLDFRHGARPYALSLKDLCGLKHLEALRAAGVCSLKIEGRMKRPEYVAAAVTACVAARAGEQPDLTALRAVFSRSGFTDGYLTGRRTLDMFGARTREDVVAAAPVLGKLSQLYRSERPRVAVDMRLDGASVPSRLIVTDGKNSAFACAPAGAPNVPGTPEELQARAMRSLQKTGGTPFFLRRADFSGALPPLGASSLNAMRREALDALLAGRERVAALPVTDGGPLPAAPHNGPARPALRLRFARAEQICAADAAERIILPINAVTPPLIAQYGERLVAELPRALYPGDEARLADRLRILREAGLSGVLVENLYGFAPSRRLSLRIHGGFGLNATHAESLAAYAALGAADMMLSFELPQRAALRMGGTLPRGVVAYGRLPLMYFRACPLQGTNGCGDCRGEGVLTDRRGVAFPVRCEGRRYSVLYNSLPLYLGGERFDGMDFVTLYFTSETPDDCAAIIEAFLHGRPLDTPRTRGPFKRELL